MKTLISFHVVLLVLVCCYGSRAQTVSTLATDGGFANGLGLSVDSAGNVFVPHDTQHNVKKITPAGVVTTISASTYEAPWTTYYDGGGWVYVGDNKKIRKFPYTGGASVDIAGQSVDGCSPGTGASALMRGVWGIVRDPGTGNLFVTDMGCSRIWRVTSAGVVTSFAGSSGGFADGAGAAAKFNLPYGIAMDAQGNLFVADYLNHRIRKVTPSGVVSTYAGTGAVGSANGPASSATFRSPAGLALDGQGNLFVGDETVIRKITPNGIVSTYAGSGVLGNADGPALSAKFGKVVGLALDASGNLYAVDLLNASVRKITKQTRTISIGSSAANSGVFTTALACRCGGWLSQRITAEGATQNFECGRSIVIRQGMASFDLSYKCTGTCSTKYEAVITKPDGTTQTVAITNNANWSYDFNMPGNYSISFKTYCDDSMCSDSCIYTLSVK